jgi:hypothetical protein
MYVAYLFNYTETENGIEYLYASLDRHPNVCSAVPKCDSHTLCHIIVNCYLKLECKRIKRFLRPCRYANVRAMVINRNS